MKNKIETIPVTEAYEAGGECPFCHMERAAEQRTIRHVLGPGASYMEPHMRGITDRAGFCRGHYKKLYDFSNALGNALMMQSHYAGLIEELDGVLKSYEPPQKKSFFLGRKKQKPQEDALAAWAKAKTGSCYICARLEETMDRYYSTFFALIKEQSFRTLVEQSKGMCICHFAQLMERAEEEVPQAQWDWFYETVPAQMRENLVRVKGDIDWFTGMFDYRNAGRDWKNSADAVSRGMQKLKGGFPADDVYRNK